MSKSRNRTPGSISISPEDLEEFYCVMCEETFDGYLAWDCSHGEAFDCCFVCVAVHYDDSCRTFKHQRKE